VLFNNKKCIDLVDIHLLPAIFFTPHYLSALEASPKVAVSLVTTHASEMLFAIRHDSNSWKGQSASARRTQDSRAGYRTREPWLRSRQNPAKAMPSKRSEQRQTMKVSWFTESKACSKVVIGTVQ
jgi:hypothetical protein